MSDADIKQEAAEPEGAPVDARPAAPTEETAAGAVPESVGDAETEPAEASDSPDSAEAPAVTVPERDTSRMQWFVVHTYSGYENKARLALEERIKREEMDAMFGAILIPTEEVVEMKRGKRHTSRRKFFPGYMLVQMEMSEASWYLVKSTPKITGFVGGATRPPPVPEDEVRRVTSQIAAGSERVKPKIVFEKGDAVRVVDGPFANFNGVIDEVESEKGKLRVLVSIFGRATPVEMEFVQVEKT